MERMELAEGQWNARGVPRRKGLLLQRGSAANRPVLDIGCTPRC